MVDPHGGPLEPNPGNYPRTKINKSGDPETENLWEEIQQKGEKLVFLKDINLRLKKKYKSLMRAKVKVYTVQGCLSELKRKNLNYNSTGALDRLPAQDLLEGGTNGNCSIRANSDTKGYPADGVRNDTEV
jgi:DNA uptake protein ComE-like DNA-binding protein